MDAIGRGSGTTFEEASKRFMDIFDDPDSRVQPVGVKLIFKEHENSCGISVVQGSVDRRDDLDLGTGCTHKQGKG